MKLSRRAVATTFGTVTLAVTVLAVACLLPGPDTTTDARGALPGTSRALAAASLRAGAPGPAAGSAAGRLAAGDAPAAPRRAARVPGGSGAPLSGSPGAASVHFTAPASARANAPGAASEALAGGTSRAEPRVLSPEQKEKLALALAKVDWDRSLKNLVAAMKAARTEGDRPNPDANLEVARINLALAEAAQALGLRGPAAALGDPNVRSAVVPAWLNALGVNVDDAQAARIAERCLALPPASPGPNATFLEARQSAVQARIALEQSLASVLTPAQLSSYATSLADDPLMSPTAAQLSLSARAPRGLSQSVTSYWTQEFKLDAPSQEAARAIASQYVAAVMAVPPVAANLDPPAARLANLDRTSRLVSLQQQAEQALAASGTLSPAERARATSGSGRCLQLALSH